MSQVFEEDVVISLAELASALFQEQVWMRPSTRWESSYVECISRLFDDSGLQDALRLGNVFGEEIDDHLRRIDDLTDRIDFKRSHEDIVRDPDFKVCSRIAANILPFVILSARKRR
jgi:hypothetical protein